MWLVHEKTQGSACGQVYVLAVAVGWLVGKACREWLVFGDGDRDQYTSLRLAAGQYWTRFRL